MDRGQVAGQVAKMRAPGGGDESGRQEPVELCADVGDRLGLCRRRLGGQQQLHFVRGGQAPSRRGSRCRSVVGTSAPATRSRSAANSSRVHTGSGARVSAAASAQSLSSADREPPGLVPSIRRVRGSSCRSTALTGEATLSRSSRRDARAHRTPLFRSGGEHAQVDGGSCVDKGGKASHGRVPRPSVRRPAAVRRGRRASCAIPFVPARRRPRGRRPAEPAPRGAPVARAGPCRARPRCRRRIRPQTSLADAAAACPGRRRRSAPERRCDGAIRVATPPAAAHRPGRCRPAPRGRCRGRERSCAAGLLAVSG